MTTEEATGNEVIARQRVRSVLQGRLGLPDEQLQESASGYCFRLMSSYMCVLVHEHAPGRLFVRLQGIVAEDAPFTPYVCQYIATHGGDWLYGHLNAIPDDAGTCKILLRHEFADHHLTDDLLEEGVRKFAGTLEELDDQVVATFGGHRKFEDS